jgi:hypothetical protein
VENGEVIATTPVLFNGTEGSASAPVVLFELESIQPTASGATPKTYEIKGVDYNGNPVVSAAISY